ncbi:MAG: hypothetical protein Q7S16_05335 [bacterium]|nr:hypothetical protein [bacterium]
MKIIPSLLVHSQNEFEERIGRVKNFVSHIHIDVADGIFVPNTTWADADAIDALLPNTMTYEAHFMVVDPLRACARWAHASKMTQMIFHVETIHHIRELIDSVRRMKKEIVIACNPETPIEKIQKTARLIDGILMMGVHPGFSAQAFEENILEKIRTLRVQYPALPITVDGGVSEETALLLKEAGATALVSANYLFSQPDIGKAIKKLQHAS